MNSTLRSWHEKGYLNYSLIPSVALGLVITHQIYLNIPQKDDRPSFIIIGGVSEGSVGGLSVVFSGEDEEWRVGDEFVLEFTLTNHDEEYVRRIGLPFFDVRIHDENGIQVARWSDGRRCPETFSWSK